MSAHMIATITVNNPEKFQRYLTKTQEVAAPYGAELLFRGVVDKTLTGEDKDHRLAVIVKFPRPERPVRTNKRTFEQGTLPDPAWDRPATNALAPTPT